MADDARNAPDADLIARIARGDPEAITAFYERWFPQFRALAARVVGNDHDADDLAQEAVVRVITRAGTFEPGAAARPWLVAVVFNLARDLARRKKLRQAHSTSDADDGPPAAEIADREPTAAERAEAAERRDAVRAALNELTGDEREVILLRDYEGLDAVSTARVLDITPGKVGSRLFRARRRLGALLQTDWPTLFPPREL